MDESPWSLSALAEEGLGSRKQADPSKRLNRDILRVPTEHAVKDGQDQGQPFNPVEWKHRRESHEFPVRQVGLSARHRLAGFPSPLSSPHINRPRQLVGEKLSTTSCSPELLLWPRRLSV
jgi:hypothetical protein